MNRMTGGLSAALVIFGSASAGAAEVGAASSFEEKVPAPREALELTIGAGYTQGAGDIRTTPGNRVDDVSGAGFAVDAGVGYRFDPRWQVALGGEYHELNAIGSAWGGGARGAVFGMSGAYHLLPYDRLDPWLQVGAGYRLLWVSPNGGPTILSHGFEIARLAFGCDIRTSPAIALGPMVGADISTFLFQAGPNVRNVISDYGVSTFFFAGVQGRFDLAGKTESGPGPRIAAE